MYNFEKKLNKYILTEAYKFETIDDVKKALQSNQIGVKISKKYDLAKDESSQVWKHVSLNVSRFLKKCDELGIKDKTYGVQFLLSHCSEPNDLGNAVSSSDALYTYLQNYKKPWIKKLPVYKQFVGSTNYDESLWHTFEKQIQNDLTKHGKANKGSGDKKEVKTLYQKDADGWELLMPLSFQGEKAAAFYGKEGEEQTPTEWCTRCNPGFYDMYTDGNQHPLYIIRNWKTGKSYQIGFTKPDSLDKDKDYISVHFLDHKDVKGDEITLGNLEKIPNELLKCIRIPFKTKIGEANKVTMLDFKNAEAKDLNEGKKGYADKTKTTFGNQRAVDNKYLEAVMERRGYTPEQAKDFAKNSGGIIVSISKGGTFPDRRSDSMQDYFNKGQKTKNIYQPKAGIYRYSFKNTPNKYVEIIASKKAGAKPTLNNISDNLDNFEREILQYTGFLDLKQDIIKTYKGHDEKFIISKNIYKINTNEAETRDKLKKIHDETERECGALIKSAGFSSFKSWEDGTGSLTLPKDKSFRDIDYHTGMPGRKIELTKAVPTQQGTRCERYEAVISKNLPFKKEFVKIYDEDSEKITDSRVIELAWKLMQTYNKYWRKEFASEIIQNRQEGNYKINMYEEVNYFEY